jgi:hypothetical protein
MSWTGFAAIFKVFFLTHSLWLRPSVKAWLTRSFGICGFGLGYSLLSLAMLSPLIRSAGQALICSFGLKRCGSAMSFEFFDRRIRPMTMQKPP